MGGGRAGGENRRSDNPKVYMEKHLLQLRGPKDPHIRQWYPVHERKNSELLPRSRIEQRFVSVAHPQANGQVEMTNRTLCDGIQKRLEKSKGKWADELDSVLWAHRTSPKTATGETPFSLTYGSEAVTPTETRLESFRVETYDEEKNEELRRQDLDLVDIDRETAFLRAAKYKSQIKATYDKKVRVRQFKKGDLVLKRADALKQTGKFEPNWEGPFTVTEVLGGGAYFLSDMGGRPLTRAWNAALLKKFYE